MTMICTRHGAFKPHMDDECPLCVVERQTVVRESLLNGVLETEVDLQDVFDAFFARMRFLDLERHARFKAEIAEREKVYEGRVELLRKAMTPKKRKKVSGKKKVRRT